MTLERRLPAEGNWLFRWRSFLPLVMVGGALLAQLPIPSPDRDSLTADVIEVVGLFISFLGLLGRAFTVGHTPARTSGRNTVTQIADSLNTTGVYSLVRHPLYFANFLIGLGLAVFTLNLWFVGVYILTFWLYYERIMLAEEAFLRSQFSYQFEAWAARTPPFCPRLSGYVTPSLPFSLKNVLKREYNTVLQIVVVAFILEVAGDAFQSHQLRFSTGWIVFLAIGASSWFVLRMLKRHTRVLHVEGR
jgi:protein-S-isoprenylcysteine O-methyltransferase Ste14